MLLPAALTEIISLLGHIGAALGTGASTIDAANHLPFGPLPTSGQWSAQYPFTVPAGARRVAFLVQYTGADAAAQLAFRVRKGFIPPGASLAVFVSELSVDDGSILTGTDAEQTAADQVLVRPVSGTADTAFAVDVDVTGGWSYILLELAERGAPLTPGTARVDITGSY